MKNYLICNSYCKLYNILKLKASLILKKSMQNEQFPKEVLNNYQSKKRLININVMHLVEYYLVKHAEFYEILRRRGMEKKYIHMINELIKTKKINSDIHTLENIMLSNEANIQSNEDIVKQIVTTFCLIDILK